MNSTGTGRTSCSAPDPTARADEPVITISPAMATTPRIRTLPTTAVAAWSGPPTTIPSTPPAAPSSPTGSSIPGRPRTTWSSALRATTNTMPPTAIRARGSVSSSVTSSPRIRAIPTATSPSGMTTRNKPIPTASPSSSAVPIAPAAPNQTLSAVNSPTRIAPRPHRSAWCPDSTAPTACRDAVAGRAALAGARFFDFVFVATMPKRYQRPATAPGHPPGR